MKYKYIEDMGGRQDEDPNKETVRIYDEFATGNKVKFAAECKASILGPLIDKELLVFNLFYVKSSKSQDQETRNKLKDYFVKFVEKYFNSNELL